MSSDAVPLHLAEWPYKSQEGALRERLQALFLSVQEEGNFDLSRLEGVTVAENLTAALRAFDAGYESDHSAAMRETVVGRMITTLRDGKIQGHIFLPVDAALQLLDPRAPLHRSCTYVFVHECAHVHDLAQSAAAIPGEILSQPLSPPLSICLKISWNEYAACRLAAYSYPDQIEDMRESLRQAIEAIADARLMTRAVFAPNGEGRQRGLTTALNAATPLLQAFSCLLGHCRGLNCPLSNSLPENRIKLEQDAEIAKALQRLEQELDALWSSYGAWSGFGVFDGLIAAICDVVKATTGLVMKRGEGLLMEVGLSVR
jgi:hypothetical protein